MLPADPKELRRTLTRMVQSGGVWANAASSGSAAESQINTPLGPERTSDPKQLVRELAGRWRASFMPHALNARYKREWNLFLCLEVGFFFPLRRGGSIPANIGQIGVLLSDREHIALVIADGDQRKAASYLIPSYEEFWRSIVPDDQALPYTTVSARIDRAIRLLATAVHWEPGLVRQIETVPSEVPSTRPTQSALPFVLNSALSQYLGYGLPDEPKFVPEEWRSLVGTDGLGRLTTIRGRTGTGKTQLMKWFAHELRRTGAIPLYVSLPSFAMHASQEDILTYVSTHEIYANLYRDNSAVALQRELAEEERSGSLVVLADCPDELLDSELASVATALSSFKRVVVGERHDDLPLGCQQACGLDMPRLHPQSLAAVLAGDATTLGLPFEVIDEIRSFGLADNLALVIATARLTPTRGPSSQVRLGVEQWIDQRFKGTRQVPGHSVNLLVARKLLEILARTEAGMEGPENWVVKLAPERIEYALRQLEIWVQPEMGLETLSFLRRTGLVNSRENPPVLSYPGLCRLIAEKRPEPR